MNKFSKVFLAGVCALSTCCFFACGGDDKKETTFNGQTGAQVYETVEENLNAYAKNFTSITTFDVDVKVTMDGQSMDMKMKLSTENKISGEDEYAKTSMVITMLGQSETQTSEAWYVDGVLYTPAYMVKEKITWEEYYARNGWDIDESKMPLYELTDSVLEGSYFKTEGEDVALYVTISGDNMEDIAGQITGSMGVASSGFNFSKIDYVIHLTNDLDGGLTLKYIEIDFTMSAVISGAQTKYKFDGRMDFLNLNTTEVSAPANADEYTPIGSGWETEEDSSSETEDNSSNEAA